jgi:hypothetical protein
LARIAAMQQLALGHWAARFTFGIGRSLERKAHIMSIHPFPRRPLAAQPVEPYFQTDPGAETVVRLRPLTALEQMYAYWGSDREAAI